MKERYFGQSAAEPSFQRSTNALSGSDSPSSSEGGRFHIIYILFNTSDEKWFILSNSEIILFPR